MHRLGDKTDKYVKPLLTMTEKLSQDDIKQYLEDYDKINKIADFDNIRLGTHIRYLSLKDGEYLFRYGGTLINKTGLPLYIILHNGSRSWSVQVKDTIFFAQLTTKQVKQEYQEILDKKNEEIKHLIKLNKDLIKQVKKLSK
jgi:hypothetical protein